MAEIIPNPDYLKKPPIPEMDLAVVAIRYSEALILWTNRYSGIFYDMEAVGADEVASGLLDKDSPDHGVWIWEGHVVYTVNHEGDGDVEYCIRCWRNPTEKEWEAIRGQRSPFEEIDDLFDTQYVAYLDSQATLDRSATL